MLKKISIYLIGLIPLSLVVGPLIGELLLFSIFIIFIYYFIEEKLFYLFESNLLKVFFLFWIYIVTLSFFAVEIFVSIKSSFFYIRFALYTVSIVYFLTLVKDSIKVIYNIYKYTLVFVILDSFVQIFFGADIFGLEPNSTDLMRISGPFGSKFVLGSFLQKILPVFIYLILKNYHVEKKIKLFDTIIIIFTFAIIYRSGDRSALGLIIFFSLIFFAINKSFRKKMLAILLFFIIISSVFTFHNPKIFKRNFTDTLGQFKGQYYEKFLNKEVNETNLNFMLFSFDHQTHYTTAFRMFLDKPIFGHGVKMFRYKCKNFAYIPKINYTNSFGKSKKYYGCSTHPHNTYLQILSETGLIGFLFIFSLFAYLLLQIFSMIKNNNKFFPESALLIGIFINLWPIIPAGNFFNNWLSMAYFIPISYYLYEIKYNTKKKIA